MEQTQKVVDNCDVAGKKNYCFPFIYLFFNKNSLFNCFLCPHPPLYCNFLKNPLEICYIREQKADQLE